MKKSNREIILLISLLITLMIFTGTGYAGVEDKKRYDAALDHFQKTKNYDQAITELNEAIKLKPKNAPAYNLLGWCYVKKDRLDLAYLQFQKAVELDRDNISALGGLGLCHYSFGKDKEAIEVGRKVLNLTSRKIQHSDYQYYSEEDKTFLYDFQGDSYAIIGMASQRVGKFEDAIRNLENALKNPASWSDTKDLRLRLAQCCYAMKKYGQAQEEYSKLLSGDPKSVDALVGRGWIYFQQSKIDEAEKDFLAACKINSFHASAGAGLVEVRKHRTAKTKEAWELLAGKEYDKAIAAFKKAMEQHPNWSVLHDGLGWSYYWKSMMADAEDSFENALRLDPGLPSSLTGKSWVDQWRFAPFNAALALMNTQQYDKAIAAFNEILKDKSTRFPINHVWRVYDGLGWTSYWKGDYGTAENSFKESTRQLPKNADSLKGLGFTYFALKQFDAAIRELGQSLAQYGAQADVQTMIGWSYYHKKDYGKALEAFEKGLKIHPYWTDAFAGMGFSQHQRGEKEKALSSFRSVIWLLPRHMATKEFKEMLDKEKTYWPLYADWGWSYFYQWMFPESEEQFTLALKKFPDRPDLLRGLGYAQYRLKKYDAAISTLEKSWKLDPKLEPVKEYITILNTPVVHLVQSDAQSRIGWSYYFKEDYDQAMTVFKGAIDRQPSWVNLRTGLAWCLFMKGKYDEAEKVFKEAQKADPNYPDSYNGLNAVARVRYAPANKAWNYYYLGDFDKAIREFKAAIEAKPQLLPEKEVGRLPLGIAWSLYWKKDYTGAAEEFKKVLAKASDDFSAHQGLGYIHFQNKDFDQAMADFQASLKAYAGNIDVQSNLGWTYLKKGDEDNAIKAFESAVSLNPYLADPYKGLAWSQWKKGKKAQAKDNFAKAIAIYPKYVEDEDFEKAFKGVKEGIDLYGKLGWSYYQKGLFKEAQQKFEQVLAQTPDNADALSGLAYLSYSQKNYDRAISYFEKALAKEPSLSNVRADLAWSYYFKENFRGAKEEFEKIVSAFPNVATYQSGLGWTLYRLKNMEGARQAFKAALKLNPYDPSAIEGLKDMGQK
jgi:tetratricopeptide (TPR) repeat protein